ncbi:Nuclear fragile X mental retardation-interacting protein 1, conserved domain protein [Kalmanozyma brasiliensis GHG001]|uniref:Nuclear fragile X mental retardation-interacting protein 1, conserved domain protein n=1 Tax=Kalmanozyma brasiliensis (strain GHG001) TaxID=1365824 RepID=UPI002867F8B6|nr:Nuclear fragile X mental retardation-interacting protein 1, conserved domain protein [Kalmanozyma brasiliensis GHG001]EST10049.2 Nuclear fragile X mental retardation-interacting protein 1, conserved domain protein [Kalmanozyma brasiliensis GHG001]
MSGRPSTRGHVRGGGGRGERDGPSRGRGRGQGRGRGTFAQHHQPRDSGYAARRHHDGPGVGLASQSHGSLCCDYVDENPPSSSADTAATPFKCNFRTHSHLALVLHKADRHLIYPDGGVDELKRLDPMLIAEQREQQRRMRQNQRRQPHPLPNRPRRPSIGENEDEDDGASDGSEEDDTDSDDSEDDDTEDDSSDADSQPVQAPQSKAQDSARVLDGPADATISGLNIQLDSPELIAEWINQRKKRWPTQSVVQEKLKDRQERQQRSEAIYGPRPTPFGKRPREDAVSSRPVASEQAATSSVDADKRQRIDVKADTGAAPAENADPAGDDDSDSDDDAPEEVSSKVAVPSLEEEASVASPHTRPGQPEDRRPICTHFLQGRCNYGDRCKKRHDTAPKASAVSSSHSQQHQAAKTMRRPHPRPPPTNPFDQPDLLRQLLRNEIEKHVDAVGQAIRFIVDNDMLLHVETEEVQAEEQRERRAKIQIVSADVEDAAQPKDESNQEQTAPSSTMIESPSINEPLIAGALAVTQSQSDDTNRPGRSSLYQRPSPTLRALSELTYPPEPDPLIYLDPLRRDDPKPLLPSQLVRIAKDPVIRSVLTPSTPLHPHGHKPASLERAVISLDALPTDLYRNAAIEMILGIASNAPQQHSGGLVVTSKDGRRKVSETDLFRMGLRVGGDEVLAIKKLADRLSVLLDSSLQLDEVGESDWALLTAEQRDEMRKLHYEREADRLDRLRKLGIDV